MRVAATSKVGSWDTMAARVCVAATTKVGSIVAEVGTTNVDFIGCVFEPLAFTFSPAVPNHEVGIFTFINRFIGGNIHIHNAAKHVTLSNVADTFTLEHTPPHLLSLCSPLSSLSVRCEPITNNHNLLPIITRLSPS